MSKKQLAKFIADQVDEFLKKGGKVKKVPSGKAKGADDTVEAKPKNLPRDKQGRTLKFDADNQVKFKEGGTSKKASKRKVTKKKVEEAGKKALDFIRPGMSRYEALAKKRAKALKERIEKGEPDQDIMDRQSKDEADELKSIGTDSKKGINIKKGGLVLRVTNRGPLYKGKKSGNKNS